MRAITLALFLAAIPLGAVAAESTAGEFSIKLKQAPGVEQVEANCAACHSLDYVQMNSAFLTASGWDAEVTKMIKTFGAPIGEADAATIASYLKANYGK
jgi:sulfite dehydrogenase (cytochrome) subunit B